MPIALLLLPVSSVASAKIYYPNVTSVTLGDHQALIEGHCDAPVGTLIALTTPDLSSFRVAWYGQRVSKAVASRPPWACATC